VTAVDMTRIMQGVPEEDQETRHRRQQEHAGIIKQRIEESVSEFESACTSAGIRHKLQCELSDPLSRFDDHRSRQLVRLRLRCRAQARNGSPVRPRRATNPGRFRSLPRRVARAADLQWLTEFRSGDQAVHSTATLAGCSAANSESTLAGLLVRQAVGTTALHLIKNADRAFFLSHWTESMSGSGGIITAE